MRAFQFSYRGAYLGGVLLVVANDLEEAKKLALATLETNVDKESLVLQEQFPLDKPAVIYNDDGD